MEDNKQFIYSALPLKYSQKRLIALVKRSLTYSDLTELEDYSNGNRSAEEKRDLFIEVVDDEMKQTSLSEKQMQTILENLASFLSAILRISVLSGIYVEPRDPQEYHRLVRWFSRLQVFGRIDARNEKLQQQSRQA